MKLKYRRQKIAVITTVTVALLVSLLHIFIYRSIKEVEHKTKLYERLAQTYQEIGTKGVRDIMERMAAKEEYDSDGALIRNMEQNLSLFSKTFPSAINDLVTKQTKSITNLRYARFLVNIAVIAVLIAGYAVTAFLGLKE